ncbi:hypothetical protein VKT23_012841 [Stygiomarasmius scandens]|uniref:Nucleoplasmin-like domain-containing protein n=1 Tax=Marasmiellus scandens TaxID=2682957 RepID=A0ABR1J4H0_9AGAR
MSSIVPWIQMLPARQPGASESGPFSLNKTLHIKNACLQTAVDYVGESVVTLSGLAENSSGFMTEHNNVPICVLSSMNPCTPLDITLPPGRYTLKLNGRNGAWLVGHLAEVRVHRDEDVSASARRQHRPDREHREHRSDRADGHRRHPAPAVAGPSSPAKEPAVTTNEKKRKRDEVDRGDDQEPAKKKGKGKEKEKEEKLEETSEAPEASGSGTRQSRRRPTKD